MTFNPVRYAAVGSGSHLLCFLSDTYQSLYHPKGKERSFFLEDPIQICYISSHFSQNSLLIPFPLKTFALHMQHPLSHLHCITTFLSALFILTSFAFRQVCDWLYPLMNTFPVLLCNTGVFMFPDMMAPAPGYYLGVVLSSELPAAERELFQDLLTQMTDFRVQVSWNVRFNRKHALNIPLNTVNQCNKVLFWIIVLCQWGQETVVLAT